MVSSTGMTPNSMHLYTGLPYRRVTPRKHHPSTGGRETIEFDVIDGEKSAEAANVVGPGGFPVADSKQIAECNYYKHYKHYWGPLCVYQQNYLNKESGEKERL